MLTNSPPVNGGRQRLPAAGFAREMAESLRVKRQAPLGEEEIARMLKERRNE